MGALLPACFVVSGAAALILQVVWVRKLVEIFGSSTLAIATVLAAFMGGLALGSAWGGRLADNLAATESRQGPRRRTDPFLYYGLAEGIVALSALAVPTIISSFRWPNAWLWMHLSDWPSVLGIARFALTSLVLLIPTTAMGATLPLLVRRASSNPRRKGRSLGRNLSILYGANTLGALGGAAAAGFILIPSSGAHRAGTIAAALAGALALLVVVSVWRGFGSPSSNSLTSLDPDQFDSSTSAVEKTIATETVAANAPSERPTTFAKQLRRLALVAYATSGAVAMALEVLYSRALAVVNGSSVTSFTLVLVVFLGGLSLGAFLVARFIERSKNLGALLGTLVAAASLAVLISVWMIDKLPALSVALLESGDLDRSSITTVHGLITALTITPVTLCFGAIMPVAIATYQSAGVGDSELASDVGRAYAANTIGAIIGSVGCGFWLMPMLSIEWTLRALVAALAVTAAVLFARTLVSKRRATCLAAVALIAALAAFAPRWDRSDFTTGLFRVHVAETIISAGEMRKRDVLFYADGAATTVSVERLANGVKILKNNGKVEASSSIDMPTQILVGLLPTILHDSPADVFVVGYGSGVTIGAITRDQRVDRIDVAEIEPEVFRAADRHFADVNHAAHQSPTVHRQIGDGRNVLLAGGRRYDVIVSEPSNPWIAGVASLFTREFYAFAKSHLKTGGLFCQWAQLYELGPANVKMIYRTFSEAFPYVYAFFPGDQVTDTILIGSEVPVDLDPARLAPLIASSPPLAAELERAEMNSAEAIVASAFMLPQDLASFTAGASINTDDNAALEYRAARDLLSRAGRASFATQIRSSGWPYGRLDKLLPPRSSVADRAMARALLEYGAHARAEVFYRRARRMEGTAEQQRSPSDLEYRLIELVRARSFADPELSIVAGGQPLPPVTPALFEGTDDEKTAGVSAVLAAYPAIATGKWKEAYQAIRSVPKRANTADGHDVTLLLGYLAYKATRFRRAERALAPLAADPVELERRPAALYFLGRARFGRGHFRSGIKALTEFATRFPDLADLTIGKRL